MLKRFYEAVFPAPSAPPSKERLPLATCVVLLQAARADDHFSDAERRHILSVLQNRFRLDSQDAEELLAEATDVTERTSDLFQFTRAINEGFTQQEKIAIMEEVWRLVLSDGILEGEEDHLAHKLRNLLNLNHPQMIETKMRVLKEVRGQA